MVQHSICIAINMCLMAQALHYLVPLYATKPSAPLLLPTDPHPYSLISPQGDPYELYKQQFDERYNGNRAPLGIFIHAAWLIADPT